MEKKQVVSLRHQHHCAMTEFRQILKLTLQSPKPGLQLVPSQYQTRSDDSVTLLSWEARLVDFFPQTALMSEILLVPDLDCQPSVAFSADDMVGSALKTATRVDNVPHECAPPLQHGTSHSNSFHYSKNKDMSPGAFCMQGRAFGAPRRPPPVNR